MLFRRPAKSNELDLRLLDPLELFQLCAGNCEDSDVWSEFLRRYTIKFRYFIRGTLRQVSGHASNQKNPAASGSIQEGDLIQNVIVRLVENDCAAMKRFSGTSENDLLAYLAVICRSTVLDTLRRTSALKRRTSASETEESMKDSSNLHRLGDNTGFEREILVRELVSMFTHTIKSRSGQVSDRDQVVFQLHFFDGLSYSQISQCKGINLSKAGVEKLLKRLVDRVQILASSGSPKETLQ
jgi:RNA polymerase sigma factor (sigma-70 family)